MYPAGKYNPKLTLLSVYNDCLGGFMSREKTSFVRGGAINDRFRFSRDVRAARVSRRKEPRSREEEGDSVKWACFSQLNHSYHIRRKNERTKVLLEGMRAVLSFCFLFPQDRRFRGVARGKRSDGEKAWQRKKRDNRENRRWPGERYKRSREVYKEIK